MYFCMSLQRCIYSKLMCCKFKRTARQYLTRKDSDKVMDRLKMNEVLTALDTANRGLLTNDTCSRLAEEGVEVSLRCVEEEARRVCNVWSLQFMEKRRLDLCDARRYRRLDEQRRQLRQPGCGRATSERRSEGGRKRAGGARRGFGRTAKAREALCRGFLPLCTQDGG